MSYCYHKPSILPITTRLLLISLAFEMVYMHQMSHTSKKICWKHLSHQLFKTYFLFSALCISVCLKVSMCAWMQLPIEARRRCWISWGWSYGQLWDSRHGFKEPNSGPLQEQSVLFTLSHLSSPYNLFIWRHLYTMQRKIDPSAYAKGHTICWF